MAKLTNILQESTKPFLSLEITPPERGSSIDEIFRGIDQLLPFNPKFINVTYHQPHIVFEEVGDKIIKRPKRKKPGTVGICAAIKNKYKIDPIPHFLCGGFDIYETEDALIDLHYLGIENILALRGDPPPGERFFIKEKDGHEYSSELIGQIKAMNKGVYLEDLEDASKTDFCIGAACYPEKHFEALNMTRDMEFLKQKVDMGVDYLVTQMFYDPKIFIDFVCAARDAGIDVPIIPGIKPVSSFRQLKGIPGTFHVSIPHQFIEKLEKAGSRKEEAEICTSYMALLVKELLDFGVPALHIFTMGKGRAAKALLERVW